MIVTQPGRPTRRYRIYKDGPQWCVSSHLIMFGSHKILLPQNRLYRMWFSTFDKSVAYVRSIL